MQIKSQTLNFPQIKFKQLPEHLKYRNELFFVIGIVLSLTPVVLFETVGLDMLPDSMGMTNLFSAIGTFIGPPFAG